MTTTATLKDSGPTTTITFDYFTEIDWRIEAKNFNPIGLPDNEGALVIFEGQFLEVLKVRYVLQDDATYPASGDSCSDKWDAFRTFVKSGGDSDYLFTLTFDKEDSGNPSPSTQSLDGKVKMGSKRLIYGKHVNYIEGEFEFWVCDE